MSYVLTTPEMLAAAATDVGNIGSAISTASSTAAGPTTGLLPAAEDEVSAAIAKLFGAYGQEYQASSLGRFRKASSPPSSSGPLRPVSET